MDGAGSADATVARDKNWKNINGLEGSVWDAMNHHASSLVELFDWLHVPLPPVHLFTRLMARALYRRSADSFIFIRSRAAAAASIDAWQRLWQPAGHRNSQYSLGRRTATEWQTRCASTLEGVKDKKWVANREQFAQAQTLVGALEACPRSRYPPTRSSRALPTASRKQLAVGKIKLHSISRESSHFIFFDCILCSAFVPHCPPWERNNATNGSLWTNTLPTNVLLIQSRLRRHPRLQPLPIPKPASLSRSQQVMIAPFRLPPSNPRNRADATTDEGDGDVALSSTSPRALLPRLLRHLIL